MDEYDETIYGKVSGRPDLVEQWKDGCRVSAYERKAWVKKMRALGVRASHPDDGWVDRENNHLQLCYPDFERSLAVGSLIALGGPENYRLVRVTKVDTEQRIIPDSLITYEYEPHESKPTHEAPLIITPEQTRAGRL